MRYKLIIKGKLPGLNEYIAANRKNPYIGNKMKQDNEKIIIWEVRQQLKKIKINKPVKIQYSWYEENKKRDHDNVSSYGRKVIQDALVKAGILKNDGWNEVVGFTDNFFIDKKNPRIEIILEEVAGE